MNAAPFLAALEFAADRHRTQKRKDAEASPYVNHLIAVTRILAAEGDVHDEDMLIAAVLHDTVEDTPTTPEELESLFGATVAGLVREMTDDKRLEKEERKRLQIVHAPHLSLPAKQLKIADKIANIRDIAFTPPADWPRERKLEYFAWAEQVVAGCRGVNQKLDQVFDEAVAKGRAKEDDVAAFAEFVAASPWRFAKTYVESYPHEYTLVQQGDPDRFRAAIGCIERWGVVEPFWGAERKYLYVDHRKYWHMGDPSSEKPENQPTLINRTWQDVTRYRENARALGFDEQTADKLAERWKMLLERARLGGKK